ncbi:MAG: hypothetical protein AAB539_03450 [Patescibacteria group bacterium]
MPIAERQRDILNAAIRYYIETARPVSSHDIVEQMDLGVSPATVRSDLADLDIGGFLYQPHASAGRIPTERGYRFFVDHLEPEEMPLASGERKNIASAFRRARADEFVQELARALSGIAGTFAVAGSAHPDSWHTAGFAEIFEEPEFRDADYARNFGYFADRMEEEMDAILGNMASVLRDDVAVLIGEENPRQCARQFGMTISLWSHPKGFHGFAALVGPKRTDYSKHHAALSALRERASVI